MVCAPLARPDSDSTAPVAPWATLSTVQANAATWPELSVAPAVTLKLLGPTLAGGANAVLGAVVSTHERVTVSNAPPMPSSPRATVQVPWLAQSLHDGE